MRIGLALLLIAVGLIGCADGPVAEVGTEGETLYFETVARGQSAAVRDTLETVVRTPEAWAELSAVLRPVEPLDDPDFSQVMIGVVSVPANSGGYTVEVQSVERADSVITVEYTLSVPGSDCITVQALAEAFEVIEIRQAEGEVRFVRHIDHYSCGLK